MDVCRHVSEVATGQEDTDAIKAVLLTIQLAMVRHATAGAVEDYTIRLRCAHATRRREYPSPQGITLAMPVPAPGDR